MESKYNLLTRLLNNIKNVVNPDGSVAGNGPLVVHEVNEVLDKTWQEIANAVASTGAVVVLDGPNGVVAAYVITGAYPDPEENYKISVSDANTIYTSATTDGYPVVDV